MEKLISEIFIQVLDSQAHRARGDWKGWIHQNGEFDQAVRHSGHYGRETWFENVFILRGQQPAAKWSVQKGKETSV